MKAKLKQVMQEAGLEQLNIESAELQCVVAFCLIAGVTLVVAALWTSYSEEKWKRRRYRLRTGKWPK